MTTTLKKPAAITIQQADEPGHVTLVRLHEAVEVFVHDGLLCFKDPLREVRVGPLTHEQCELLEEDLGYEACATDPEMTKDRRLMRKERAAVHAGGE